MTDPSCAMRCEIPSSVFQQRDGLTGLTEKILEILPSNIEGKLKNPMSTHALAREVGSTKNRRWRCRAVVLHRRQHHHRHRHLRPSTCKVAATIAAAESAAAGPGAATAEVAALGSGESRFGFAVLGKEIVISGSWVMMGASRAYLSNVDEATHQTLIAERLNRLLSLVSSCVFHNPEMVSTHSQ